MKSVAFHNLGCKVNSYEMDVMQQKLQNYGYKIVEFNQKADVYIINTCTVTNIADRKSRQMLHRAKKQNPEAVVVAVGCYVQTAEAEIEKDPCIDLAIGNNRKKDLPEILQAYFAGRDSAAGENDAQVRMQDILDICNTQEYEEMQLVRTAEHTRAYIKIQDGCNQFCSYCVIPYARGRVRSRKPENIIREIEGLAAAGYKEVVLTGIHLSSYGLDFHGESYNENRSALCPDSGELLSVIEKVHAIEGITRIRLGSLEPRIVTEEFAQRLAGLTKVCPHFHLSLQSGCDSVLRRMNRRYTCEEFEHGAAILRAAFENPAITTDIITGFPGETEEEHEQTKAFLEKIRFFEMHVFPYSKREKTVAANMPGQLTEKVKKERSAELLAMEKRHSAAYRHQFIGTDTEVLFERIQEKDGREYLIGHTRNYLKVALPVSSLAAGTPADTTALTFAPVAGTDPASYLNREVRCRLDGFLDEETLFADLTSMRPESKTEIVKHNNRHRIS